LQALLVSALVAVAAAAPAGPLVAAPGYAAPDLAEPPVYTYQYGVNDDYSGNKLSWECHTRRYK